MSRHCPTNELTYCPTRRPRRKPSDGRQQNLTARTACTNACKACRRLPKPRWVLISAFNATKLPLVNSESHAVNKRCKQLAEGKDISARCCIPCVSQACLSCELRTARTLAETGTIAQAVVGVQALRELRDTGGSVCCLVWRGPAQSLCLKRHGSEAST